MKKNCQFIASSFVKTAGSLMFLKICQHQLFGDSDICPKNQNQLFFTKSNTHTTPVNTKKPSSSLHWYESLSARTALFF